MRITLWIGLAVVGVGHATVIPVEPGASVQEALTAARPGDIVRLAPGVHRERVVMENSGEYERPIVLEGEPGAVLDGSEDFTPEWQPADDVAPGVWRARVPFFPFTVVADGQIITALAEHRVDPDKVTDPAWAWPNLLRNGVGRNGWAGPKALALYRHGPRELLVRFGDGRDPRTVRWNLAPREPAVHIVGASRCVVRGLTIRNAAYGVLVESSLGAVVERCVIGPADYGVWLGGGADRCTVRFCEIHLSPFSGADPHQLGAWDNWLAHKVGGFYDRYGVQIRDSVGGHQVHDNWIHDHWDGIEDHGGVGRNVALRIHHNRIETMSDDGLEPNGGEEDCWWHDNVISGCICGFRIKAPLKGPLYAFRNIFYGNSEDFRNYGEVELQPAEVYVYHNTSTAKPAVMSNKVFGIGTPRYHYYNNLFWCAYWWGNSGESVEPNWQGDHNVYVQRDSDRRWEQGVGLAQRLGLDRASLFTSGDPGFVDAAAHDYSLRADSPARRRGADLQRLLGRELPGLPAGDSPDCGALPYGEPMPTLPRSPDQVEAPDAGAWPGPEVRTAFPWDGPNLLSNGGFEAGFEGWADGLPETHQLREDTPREGARYLHVSAPAGRAELRRRLTDLAPGHSYVLVYSSRLSTCTDFRVIVRDLATTAYLAQGTASSTHAWRRSVLRFTAPAAEVGLELSARAPGACDLDGFGLYEVNP